ncbi:MAG TPA: hypothetical protein VMX94_13340 [Armatimonadota bacterium]|nr:hypothetical protein [Armatimonadota bacterium]
MERRLPVVCIAFILVGVLAGCGGGGGGHDPATMTISPVTAVCGPDGTARLTATVMGVGDTTVAWSIREGGSGGTVSPTGVYTAPGTLGTYHVVATCVADPSLRATATVTVTDEVAVVIEPDGVTLGPGGTATFTASIINTGVQGVRWSIEEGDAGGSIADSGVYTAPGVSGTYHVVATSEVDPAKSATAVVTVDFGLLGQVCQLQPGDEWEYAVSGRATPVSPSTDIYDVTGKYTLAMSPDSVGTPHGITAHVLIESASLEIPGVPEPIRAYANAYYITQDPDGTIWVYGGKRDGVQYWVVSPPDGRYKSVASPMSTGEAWSANVGLDNGTSFDLSLVAGGIATVIVPMGSFEVFTVNGNGLFAGVPAVIADWWSPPMGAPAQREVTFSDNTPRYTVPLTYELTLKLRSRNR